MLPGPDGCLNPGEGGGGSYPIVNYRNDTLKCSYWDKDTMDTAQYGQNYVPFESDISIQNPGDAWFYHKGHVFDSADNLFGKYLGVVGRGSHFIINVPPNRSGLIVDEFVESVTQMGDAVRASFGKDVGHLAAPVSGKCADLSVVVEATDPFDTVLLQEGLTKGQTILGYTLETQDKASKKWTEIKLDPKSAGLTVGTKAIVTLESTLSNASAVRFRCTNAIAQNDEKFGAKLEAFSLHKLVRPSK